MYTAYETFDDDVESYLETLSAINDMGDSRNTFSFRENDGQKFLEGVTRFGSAIHLVIKTHPVSGRTFLYVNETFTQHILVMVARESRNWLNCLLDHVNRP